MIRLLIILLLLPLIGYSQEKILFSDTLYCVGSCYDECNPKTTFIEIWQYEEGGISIHFNFDPNDTELTDVINIDVKKYGVTSDGYMYKPWKNKYNIKKIYSSSDGVILKHRHNIFYKHWLVYH